MARARMTSILFELRTHSLAEWSKQIAFKPELRSSDQFPEPTERESKCACIWIARVRIPRSAGLFLHRRPAKRSPKTNSAPRSVKRAERTDSGLNRFADHGCTPAVSPVCAVLGASRTPSGAFARVIESEAMHAHNTNPALSQPHPNGFVFKGLNAYPYIP